MAFGDIAEVIEAMNGNATTISGTFTQTPAAGDLAIALHFTGHASSNVDTAGFTEDQLLTNATDNDQGAIYSKVCAGASDNTVTCSSGGSDEQMLLFCLVRGPFASSPKDLSASTGRTTANPASTGVSGSSTAQADEFMIAAICSRSTTDAGSTWTRLGTATPTSAMTELSGNGIATSFKRLDGASQVLTATGTVGVSYANGSSVAVILGYATYKKDGGGGTAHELELSDSIGFSDTAPKSVTAPKSDAVTLGEALAKSATKAATDTVTLGEALARNISKPVSDSVTLGEALAKGAGKNVSDGLTIADNAVVKNTGQVLSDGLVLGEALAKGGGKVVSDSLSLGEAFSASLVLVLDLADGLTLGEATIGKNITKNVSDTIGLAEDPARSVTKPLTDAVTLGDAFEGSLVLVLSLADGITLSDGSFARSSTKALSDALSLAETVAKSAAAVFSDSFTLGETFSASNGSQPPYVAGLLKRPLGAAFTKQEFGAEIEALTFGARFEKQEFGAQFDT
jgi:hypothetical protein